jgi:4-hydroxybenzoate polyprenyltransferase
LIFAAFGDLGHWGMPGFVVFATLRGISSDVSHQMRDYENDLRTGTRTFAVKHGYRATQKLYAVSLEAERLALGGVLGLLFIGITPNARSSFPPLSLGNLTIPVYEMVSISMIALILVYLALLTRTIGRSWRAYQAGNLAENDPYNERRQAQVRDALHIIHHTLPSVILPGYLALLATYVYRANVIFIIVMILLYGLHNPKNWQRFFKNIPVQGQ